MSDNRKLICKDAVFLTLFLTASMAFAQSAQKAEDKSPHESKFVTVSTVKLHYLDWGGTGEAVVFLPGAGDSAHVYDRLAPKFTDKFRVVGLTRRGYGESDKPEKGYEVDTLVKDLVGLIDHLKLKKVHLIGHSAGGNEMFRFAEKYPKRTLKLVFLDAAYGRRVEMLANDPTARPEKPASEMSQEDKIDKEYFKYLDPFEPNYRKIKAPSLGFFVMVEKNWPLPPGTDAAMRKRVDEWIDRDVRPFQTRSIERFRTEVKKSEVIVLPNTTHYFFRDPKQFESVVVTLRRFLLQE